MEIRTSDDGKSGLAPTAPKAGRSAGATAEWKAPPTLYAPCLSRSPRKPPVKTTPKTPMIDEGARAASDLSIHSGSSAAAHARMEAWRVASTPRAPKVTATEEKVSPRMIAYAAHVPMVRAASAAGTIQAVFSPMAFFQASPSDSASLATHMRAVSEKAYAEMAPSPTMSALAGHSTAGTSPIILTPAGRARTPEPSAALQVLKTVEVKLESPSTGAAPASSSPSVAAAWQVTNEWRGVSARGWSLASTGRRPRWSAGCSTSATVEGASTAHRRNARILRPDERLCGDLVVVEVCRRQGGGRNGQFP